MSAGKLLSAVKVYGKTGDELAYEKRDSLWNDPADYFEYIMMFFWGDSLGGDYVVNSLNPCGNFIPGVRFYFRYENMLRHPGHTFDGYHPIKIKDEIILSDYLYACVIPEHYKNNLKSLILPDLADRIYYLPQNGFGINEWAEKVFELIINI